MRGKYIITAQFEGSKTSEAAYGTKTLLTFINIRDKEGKLLSHRANMKMSKMAALIWYKRGKKYKIKLCEAMKKGDGWLWYPVMIEDGDIRYSIEHGNSITQEIKTQTCVQVTENFSASLREKKHYSAPLSSW